MGGKRDYSLSFFFFDRDVASLAHFAHSSSVFLILHQVGREMSVQLLLDLSRDVQSDSKLDSGSGYSQSGSGVSPLRSGPCVGSLNRCANLRTRALRSRFSSRMSRYIAGFFGIFVFTPVGFFCGL